MAKSDKIRSIVRIRQMLRSWRKKATSSSHRLPPDVPAGHVAISVGITGRRFIVRASYLNLPIFRQLLSQAEEEYGGFVNSSGPVSIPCDEFTFEEILRFVSRGGGGTDCCQRFCHVDVSESRPLLYEFTV